MDKLFKIFKYVISGGTAAVIDLFFLYLFVEKFEMSYLLAAVIAFLIAFCASFTLQKFWTFKDSSVEKVHRQATVYLIVSVVNLGLNTLLIYGFVELLYLHYFISQIFAGALLAISSFFIYSLFIFKPVPAEVSADPEKENDL